MTDAVKNPKWEHETLTLHVGAHDYQFRTLSLYDLWILWPDIYAHKDMIARGRPLMANEHATRILAYLAPILVANEKDSKAMTTEHGDYIVDFYRSRHDWSRMETFGGETQGVAGGGTFSKEEAHQRFVIIVTCAAQYAGLPVDQFVQRRFEFCADQIKAAYGVYKIAADAGKPKSWDEVIARFTPRILKIEQGGAKPPWAAMVEKAN